MVLLNSTAPEDIPDTMGASSSNDIPDTMGVYSSTLADSTIPTTALKGEYIGNLL
jgi:hypothetical protein